MKIWHNRRAKLLLCFLLILIAPQVFSCYTYPAYHYPKPAGPYIIYTAPDAYPFTPSHWFNVDLQTNFTLPAAEFGTEAGRQRNMPFSPMTYDKKVHVYFGPNKIGSYELLNGPGFRLTPGFNLKVNYNLGSKLDYWHWRNEYDWQLINYWYSVGHRTTTYCWSGGCVSWKGPPAGSYCWSGGCSTYYVCYNNYEVYYWDRGAFLRKLKQAESKNFPVRTYINVWDPIARAYTKKTVREFPNPESGTFFNSNVSGISDMNFDYKADFYNVYLRWYHYTYGSIKPPDIQRTLNAKIHPKPAINPTWRVDVSGVWYPTIGDTKVNIRFRWNRDSLNSDPGKSNWREKYYIEYGKIFDGMIKMKDIIKMLANLGFGQIDVPVYMALEGPEPKLYLVTTPEIVKGVRIAPEPYRARPQEDWLTGANVKPGYTLHPTTQSRSRGYIRECDMPPVFGSDGKPKAGPVKYVFNKIFDVNNDDKVDNADKAFFDKAFPYADFDEDGKVDGNDCGSVWQHAFVSFPTAFEDLATQIRARFAANPLLLASGTLAMATAGPVVIPEVYIGKGTTNRYIQIGWRGNAFSGEFFVQPIPGASSKNFKFSSTAMPYNTRTDPTVTGDNFLPHLGPIPQPSLSQLYRKTTIDFPDGTLLGRLKKLTVQTYPKGCFYNAANSTSAAVHPLGDPWGIGQLESVESGWMGNIFIYGDADGNGYYDKNDMADWDKIKARDGFLLTTVWQHKIGVAPGAAVQTDNDKTFRVIAGGKFSVYPPDGVTDFVHKESYNYKFLDPTLWAYDPGDGNQFSLGRRFVLESGSSDPEKPKEPPQPPTEVRYLPTNIIGPNDIPEDIPQTWSLSGAEMVIIKPDTWTQTWRISPDVPGGTGAGTSFRYEFLQAGKYTVIHTVKYTQRIVTAVTDGLGIIVYYAATDIPQTRTLTYDVRVYDHTPADFDDPKLTLNGPGNTTTYAPQWGADAAALRERDFPNSFKAYPETRVTDITKVGIPAMTNNDWYYLRAAVNGKEYLDHDFDLVNAAGTLQNYKAKLELKFARNVNETSDLNEGNLAGNGHLEAFSGILLEKTIRMNVEVKRHQPGGAIELWRSFNYMPDRNAQGALDLDKSAMATYLVRVGSRYVEVKTVSFTSDYSWDLPIPTFPNEGYETVVTLICTRRDYYLDHPSHEAANRARFGADYSRLVLNGDGKIKYLDRDMTSIWRRKAFTVDVTPPTIARFEEFNGENAMSAIVNNTIYGNSGDQTKYLIGIEDNHPGFGPNDGLKNGGTRRSWYPSLWFQKIDGAAGRFTLDAKNGYEFPMILPSIKDKLSTAADGDLSPDIDKFNVERVDGHRLALVAPTDKEKLGAPTNREMTIQHQFSNYIAGKIKYVIEIADGSRNFTRQEGYFNVIDNKRPNLDLRLATAKYKPLPDDGSLKLLSDIGKDTPLGPSAQPFGLLAWADDALKDRVKGAKAGLFSDWRHAYNLPDQKFVSGAFSSQFSLPGYVYDRKNSLDSAGNYVVTEKNSNKMDDPKIKLVDSNVKAAFNSANPGAPGFAEDELLVFDLSVRDNILFWQNDAAAPFGRIVDSNNFKSIYYKFKEDVKDEHGVVYFKEFEDKPVKSMEDAAPLRLLNADGTPLSYVFRVGNADVKTGLKNKSGNSSGTNSFYLKVIDLDGNSRELEIDFPIIPSRFQIRVLESTTEAERSGTGAK